ncbi:MAG: trypsin-like serine peptidase, partial [Gaiellales bacterium]
MKRPSDKEVITQALKQMPRLEKLSDRLKNRPEEVLDRLEPSPASAPFDEGLERARGARRRRDPEDTRRERERVLGAGQRGLSKVRADGTRASLDREERVGLEAIILLAGRPAILIQNGTFAQPTEDEWQVLDEQRPQIEQSIKSVGRIEVDGHPSFEWIGTGFLVSDDVVMTNRHVANEFARMKTATMWSFAPGMTVRIDYVEELGSSNPSEFKVTGIIGLHQDVDMALLRVAKK